MFLRTRRLIALAAMLFPMLLGARTPVPVTVSVAPQAYFVEAIGGERVAVEVMVQPGQSSHTFSPSPRQLMALAEARVYVKVGHPDYTFEHRFLERLYELERDVRVVNMSEGIEFRELEDHTHSDHGERDSHGHHDDHGHDDHQGHDDHDDGHGDHQQAVHGETDPHVWVSPGIVRAAARDIAAALTEVDPAGRAHYEAGLRDFLREIDALDRELHDQLDGLSRRVFLVNHPAWGYFADEYGLEQRAIESEGKDASPAQLAELIEEARADGIRVIFVQAGFSRRGAEIIARELNGSVVSVDPVARDWAATLRTMGSALVEAER